VFQWNAAGENHDAVMVRSMDAEELVARLAVLGEFLRRDVKGARGEGLVDGNIDRSNPRAIHANVRNEVLPSSTTAMFMGWPISMAFFSAASMMRRASASLSIGTSSAGVDDKAMYMLEAPHRIATLVRRAPESIWKPKGD
jgi:hypothetical protein